MIFHFRLYLVYVVLLIMLSNAIYNSGGLSARSTILLYVVEVALYAELIFAIDNKGFFRNEEFPSKDYDELELEPYEKPDYEYRPTYREEDLV